MTTEELKKANELQLKIEALESNQGSIIITLIPGEKDPDFIEIESALAIYKTSLFAEKIKTYKSEFEAL